MFYISFHGGNPGVNNIYVYHDSGEPHSNPEVLNENHNITLKELRGFSFGSVTDHYDFLYVLNGYKDYNQVLQYKLSAKGDGTYDFVSVLAQGADINSIFHPYDLSFDSGGNIYVSSQDTNVVTYLSPSGAPFQPPSSLASYGNTFLSGTFVASEIGNLPGISKPYPPNVPKPLGLTVSYSDNTDTKVQNSVRGVLFYDGYLFVCDEPDSKVKIYDGTTGQLYGEIEGSNLDKPVQLLLSPRDQHLYITSSGDGSVVRVDISNGIPKGTVAPETFIHKQVPNISGIAFDDSGNFYAAERKGKMIMKFTPGGPNGGTVAIQNLPDNPEFIMYIPKGE